MFITANDLFFGDLSVGSQCFKVLMNMINQHKSIFKAKECFDKKIPAKFLFAVGTRFQIWLNKCKSAANRNEVKDSIINFLPLVNKVNTALYTWISLQLSL
jgi:hypothetical protein